MASAKKEIHAPEIINLVNINDLKGVESLLIKAEAKVDAIDDNGMTGLQHAAYKGQVDMCKLLLSYGADVDADHHDHNYSALHFGALSGSLDTVQLLLASGSKAYHLNSLGRTPAQMAGFVGNHDVVALINNYLPINNIEYYSVPHDLETEPKIPKAVVKPLYDLIMKSNLHPVYVAITVSKNKELISYCGKAYRLLQLMSEKEAKRSENVNEVLCMKFHYISYVLKTLDKELNNSIASVKEDEIVFESVIKKWLRARLSDGFEEYMEFYMRDAIKAFPYPEMPLFQQLVRNITSEASDFPSLGLLHGLINGQRGFQDDVSCGACGLENKVAKACSKCKHVHYCDKVCQKLHWNSHKRFCKKVESVASDSSRTTSTKENSNSSI